MNVMTSRTGNVCLVSICLLAALFSGCGSQNKAVLAGKWELVVAKEGIVYRINKETGEVSLIAGKGSVLVQGTQSVESKTNRVVNWGSISLNKLGDVKDSLIKLSRLGDVTVSLKTNWRDGKFYFIFSVTPYEKIKSIIESASADAQFIVDLRDEDGFVISTIPVKLGAMQPAPSQVGKMDAFEMNASLTCDLDTYLCMKSWSISYGGF